MLSVLLLAAALAAGAPPAVVVVVAGAVFWPVWFLVGVVVWSVVARLLPGDVPGPDDEARFLQAFADELRGGASLRAALANSALRAPRLDLARCIRLASTGRPMAEVAAAARSALPVNGRLAGPALALAATTGGRSADVFARLAGRAAAQGELARERNALTAQARLSAAVVAGAPLVLAATLAAGSGTSFLDLGRAGLVVGAIGLTLEAAGVAVVWFMIRKAEQ